jgi:hypothetical protein
MSKGLSFLSLLVFPLTNRVTWFFEGLKPGADFSFLEMYVQEGMCFQWSTVLSVLKTCFKQYLPTLMILFNSAGNAFTSALAASPFWEIHGPQM